MSTTNTILLSKQGMRDLKKEIAQLERDRNEILRVLHEQEKIDTHDERLDRIEKLAALEAAESDLNERKAILEHAKLFPRKRDALKVAIGSVVELIDTSGRMVRYTLVDTIEANPSDGRISIMSPLGKNLIGKQLHDIVEWTAGLRTNQLRLVGIS